MMAAATGQRRRPRCAIPLDSLVARAFYESVVESGLVAREQRKLAAILAADVVGYSRLMGRDESGTLARFRSATEQRKHLFQDRTNAKYRLVLKLSTYRVKPEVIGASRE